MDINKETEEQIKELQMLEKNMQAIMMQRQAFEMELNEIQNALNELNKSGEEIYKIAGNIMIKAEKKQILEELNHKKGLLELRLKSISSQEKELEENSESLREKVLKKIKK